MLGRKLGHYEILEAAGRGAMGEVYRARDLHLERDVAIKVLPAGALGDEGLRKRFRREALLVSKVSHGNIETVHDFDTQEGVDFLVMEYVAGETLHERLRRGALEERELVRLGVQLLRGLEAAHRAGLVHRDLKPENVRLTPGGELKILDFGLAKLLEKAHDEPMESTTVEMLSVAGEVLGTLPYMSPEQLRGEPLDHRTDVWSAGVVLYEMATGRRPFEAGTQPLLVHAILNEEPPSAREVNRRVTPALEGVLQKALEKDRELRVQTARDLEVDLQRLVAPSSTRAVVATRRRGRHLWLGVLLGAAGLTLALFVGTWLQNRDPTQIQAMVVLPLVNRSGNPDEDYFTEGFTDELTVNLAQVQSLRIISRTSASKYKGTLESVRTIGRELNVDAVVEGAVQRVGDRVRITVQLVDAATERSIWAESYERVERDVLVLQDEVARAIAQRIKATLTAQEERRLTSARAVDPTAYRVYLRGRQALNEYTEGGCQRAQQLFSQALQIDPEYAPAYAGLADCYYGVSSIWESPSRVMPLARAAALRALQLDPSLAEAHVSLGLVQMVFDWDWHGAEASFDRAIELNPGLAVAHQHHGYLLSALGRGEEAVAAYRRALDLDPLSVVVGAQLGFAYFMSRRYAEAVEQLKATIAMDPSHYYAHPFLGLVHAVAGPVDQAVAELEEGMRIGKNPQGMAQLAYAYAKAGRWGDAEAALRDAQSDSMNASTLFDVTAVYVAHGESERAFQFLQRSMVEKVELIVFLGVDPRLDPLRSDPRYAEFLRRLGLAG